MPLKHGKKETLEERKTRARLIVGRLRAAYPHAKCSLDFSGTYQLLVATILSAQCTDERVNIVTPALFARFPDAQSMARAKPAAVERLIRSTGFFKSKTAALIESAKAIVENHGGSVPASLEALTGLRGVGRKTANVVLGNAYGVPGIVVDTHVGRVSFRLGLTFETKPEKVEQDLMAVIPKSEWVQFCHELIFHGRSRCVARRPDCPHCEVADLCPKNGVTT